MRGRLVAIVAGVLVVALAAWVASNTYWGEMTVPTPLKGEAATNPTYAAEKFASALGARVVRHRVFMPPPASATLMLTSWQWNLSASRRNALQRWVEDGGHLVVDQTLIDNTDAFEQWSGISFHIRPEGAGNRNSPRRRERCTVFQERLGTAPEVAGTYRLCDFLHGMSFLSSGRTRLWTVSDRDGSQAIRVNVGRGQVTALNGDPFTYRNLFEGDHDRLFVAATELLRGQEIHFLSETEHPSLLALAWRHGAPALLLGLSLVALVLWRGAMRFGPLAAPPSPARRSLAEQIRGVGRFALAHGDGEALYGASVRALGEAASRRVPGYSRLARTEQASRLATLTGFNQDELTQALLQLPARADLRNTLALLEATRRQIVGPQTRTLHGTH